MSELIGIAIRALLAVIVILAAGALAGVATEIPSANAWVTDDTPSAPCPIGQYLAAYYDNPYLYSHPTLVRCEDSLDHDWGGASPGPGVPTDNFSARWVGRHLFADSTYDFAAVADDGVRIWLDDTLIIDGWREQPPTEYRAARPLAAGYHIVRVAYFEHRGGAVIRLSWQAQATPTPSNTILPIVLTSTPTPSLSPTPTQTATPTTGVPLVPTPVSGTSYLSAWTWTSAVSGYGPVERDTSNGEFQSGDGNTLNLNGVPYAKGLGVHAASDIRYNLASSCTELSAMVGIDEEVSSFGSVDFQVFVDGTKLFDSGVMTGDSASQAINLTNLAGKNQLQLVVTDAGDGISYDHADWADARVTCGSVVPVATNTPPAPTPTSTSTPNTATMTPTQTFTLTPTATAAAATPTLLLSPTPTVTLTLAATPTVTSLPTPTRTPTQLPRSEATVNRVTSGDSLDAQIDGKRTLVGYLGAAAPAATTNCGAMALARNLQLAGSRVLLEDDPSYQFDELGRRLYYAYTPDGQSIDAALISEGLARAVRTDARHGAELAAIEAEAQSNKRGCLWGGSQTIVPPGTSAR
jgi:endonuclease YncB( thermonuclease family)